MPQMQAKALGETDWALPFSTNLETANRPWDPYVLWAIATSFRGYDWLARTAPLQLLRVTVLLELNKAYNNLEDLKSVMPLVPSLQVPHMYFDEPKSRFVTATVDLPELDDLLRNSNVLRGQLGLARVAKSEPGGHVGVRSLFPRTLVMGVIDDSCAYAHRQFRLGDGSTRMELIWNQNRLGAQYQAPEAAGYGQERRRDAASGLRLQPPPPLVNLSDDDWYRHPIVNDLRLWPRVLHGTHVLDIMAGSPCPPLVDAVVGAGNDAAAEAALVFVELPNATVADVSGASLGSAALDGIRYIMKQAPADLTNLVINLSYGHFAGPHDETGLFTSAMTDLLEKRSNFVITLPAGNSCFPGRPIHARCCRLAPGEMTTLTFTVIPRDLAQTFVEVWVPERDDESAPTQLAFQLRAPDGSGIGPITVGKGGVLTDAADPTRVLAGLFYFYKVSQGQRGRMALVAVGPTISSDGAPVAPYGEWVIQVKNLNAAASVSGLHAWIERHDSLPGTPNQGRQPHFVMKGNEAFTLTGKCYTLNAIAHGPWTLCAGGLMKNAVPWHSSGSSANIDPDYAGNGPGRNFAAAPGAQVLSDAGAVLDGVRAAGARSGSTVRLSGTSASSALLARFVANKLQCAAPGPLDIVPTATIRAWFSVPASTSTVADIQIDESLLSQPYP